MTVSAGASRMSSVFGLNARPHTRERLAGERRRSASCAFSTSQRFCRSFTRSTARRRSKSRPTWRAIVMTARTSFGKQRAAEAHARGRGTGGRCGGPSRCPRRTSSTSAPSFSQSVAISFMNEMRVASIAFAAYFVSSAEREVHEEDRLLGADERRVELGHHRAGALGGDADDHAVGPHEVVDRRALLQELGVRDHVERCASRHRAATAGDLLGAAHRARCSCSRRPS